MSNQLQHHGVLGMKWGVRRYQNYDGSLKALGKKKQKLEDQNEKLKQKSFKYDEKAQRASAKAAKKTYKINKYATDAFTGELSSSGAKKLRKASKKLKKAQVKSAKFLKRAAKARKEIYNHEQIIKTMNKRYNELSKTDIEKGKNFCK